MDLRGTLSRDEIETFLEESTVPVRLACRTPSDQLWMVSLWYRYRSGGDDDWRLQCATAADADIASLLSADPAVAFEVSTNEPPYAGVRGQGTASIERDSDKEILRTLVERYLGGTESQLARTLLREDREEVTITIDPAVVSGWDYTDRMTDSESETKTEADAGDDQTEKK
ncbi:pyridoxamine 5'-phosphate oxidase family protein [Halopiger xanaduensis]|uniref:Pyridoxamine 5'-phosphate oxidase-related FMN-binding protein n=1 Tax=Halopiger xanaduensis (strain DSM 18323 / JCM 14033 / SH-6) TaxID=797210 RepID=F8DCR0_HALXS|nr:pyridoxamine 5'-phosphate oxidase family protein [Halopiger xanaduensis]AEH37234.1 pyridoxamine 5'-phosphate oxidase-related FMN-binding protein [Halopiger xanaduensis SH-6]